MQRNRWQPILEDSLGERALAAVTEIVAILPDPSSAESLHPSLAGGTVGLAVLYAYLSRAGLDDNQNAAQFLIQAMTAVSSQSLGTSLYAGFTGIAWAMTHLEDQLIDADDQDPGEAVDEALRTYLNRSPWRDDYDLIGGLVGLGVYLLDRLPRPSAVECLELLIDRLDETAERDAHGITWLTSPELLPPHEQAECPRGCYDLGVAHGVPGVIAFLGEACVFGVALEKTRPMLEGAVSWLLRQKLPHDSASMFSYWIAPGVEPKATRLAWCYGDLGLAAALLSAARAVGEQGWEREALEVARRAANRTLEDSGVIDTGLCHGAAGVAHLFNRLFQATGETLFKRAARFWFEQTLTMMRQDQGISFILDEDGKKEAAEDVSVLTGSAGVALALLAAATATEPVWDRILMVRNLVPRAHV